MSRNDDLDESHTDRLSRKSREAPMMLIGLAGLLVVCGIGVHKFNRRGTMPVSQFLMQLRVAAQGTVVGALTAGAVYSMLSQSIRKDSTGESSDKGRRE